MESIGNFLNIFYRNVPVFRLPAHDCRLSAIKGLTVIAKPINENTFKGKRITMII
ncbi:hypothetical protein FD17_GL001480 [Lentilactobacillus sunkii DSM 19904]|uniref:Uncharacterized protein n=1 Tax=Lentilactobacillus sunkii DSM 19904 TaxID=1423808 RepID=A0A0R1KU52_9LACO|nr:hypothetical protein FD17_GL001480 [Lentilactobacillus sunkii DSM 19904]